MSIEKNLEELREKLQQHDEALNFLTMISQAGRDAKYLGDCIVLLCDLLDDMYKEKEKEKKKKARIRAAKKRRMLKNGKSKQKS